MAGLRTLAWKGGITLAVRQVLGMVISFAGLIVLARLIGPQAYGIYVSALALHTFLVIFFQWGTDVFLLRRAEEPTPAHFDQAFTLCLSLGSLGCASGWAIGWLAEQWIGAEGVGKAVTVLFATMPLQLASLVPSAQLQRRMAYTLVAWAELGGHVALYSTALTTAFLGFGLWAPLLGWWAQQLVMTTALFALSGYRPRLIWSRQLLGELVSYGLSYSAAVWLWQLKTLVNPLIVARFLGPEAAAGVGIAVRMVESLSFMRLVLWRVSVPALARLQTDRSRLARAVSEGVRLQVLSVAPVMAAFSLVAPWLVPFAFGRDWHQVVTVFPFLAVAALANTVYSLPSSAMFVLGRNREMALFHGTYVATLFGAAAMLTEPLGLLGYGLAEVAALIAYLLLRSITERELGHMDLSLPLMWSAALALPLFVDRLGVLAWCGPLFVVLLPATWRTLATWWTQVKEATSG